MKIALFGSKSYLATKLAIFGDFRSTEFLCFDRIRNTNNAISGNKYELSEFLDDSFSVKEKFKKVNAVYYFIGNPKISTRSFSNENELLESILAKLKTAKFKGKFIFISSNAARAPEFFKAKRLSNYGKHKNDLENLVRHSELNYTILRLPSIFGEGMNKYSHLMLLKRSKIKCLFLSFAIFCGTIEILSLTKFIEEASSMIGEKRQEIDVIGNTYRIRYLAQLILGMRNINSLVPVAPRIRKPSLFVECLNVILPLNYSFLLIQKISGVGILSISESRREKAELKRFFRLDAEKNHQDVSIITGGSSGLGLEFVKIGMLKKRGKVISVDKSPNPLKLEINLVHVDLDFSKPKSVNHFVKIVEKFKPNTIILNAGIGYFGETSEMNPKKAIEILNVNLIFNLMVLIKVSKLYEDWRKNVDIKIVSSSTVYFPLTKFAMYTSTKSALHAFALSMQREKSEYVNLQLIVPGGLRTGFQNKIGYVRKLDRYLLSNPEKLALKVFKDQKRNSKVIHFGFSALLFRILQRLPRSPIEKFMNFVR